MKVGLIMVALAVSLVALCELGKGQGPDRDRERKRRRPSLPNFGDLKLASICIRCNAGAEAAPPLSDDDLAMLASPMLVGRSTRRASTLSPGVYHSVAFA